MFIQYNRVKYREAELETKYKEHQQKMAEQRQAEEDKQEILEKIREKVL